MQFTFKLGMCENSTFTANEGGFTQRRKGGKDAKKRCRSVEPFLHEAFLCVFATFAPLRET
ncbi:MAG: hypothetical protein ND866_25060, partial [Pyrinomonadaceae bacterium]|nr:hypothetical protein [Pyrinomonadaceae bacterium]